MVIPARGIPFLSRFHLLAGILSFLASPLWLALVLGAVTIAVAPDAGVTCCTAAVYDYDAPDTRAGIGTLLAMTATMLLLPRALGALLALARGPLRRAFGGAPRLIRSTLAELVLSTLIAPSLMLLHTAFIAATLVGKAIGWRAQPRDDRGVAWRDAAARLWWSRRRPRARRLCRRPRARAGAVAVTGDLRAAARDPALRLLQPAGVGTAHRAARRVRNSRGVLAPARAAAARRSVGAALPRCAAERAGSRA